MPDVASLSLRQGDHGNHWRGAGERSGDDAPARLAIAMSAPSCKAASSAASATTAKGRLHQPSRPIARDQPQRRAMVFTDAPGNGRRKRLRAVGSGLSGHDHYRDALECRFRSGRDLTTSTPQDEFAAALNEPYVAKDILDDPNLRFSPTHGCTGSRGRSSRDLTLRRSTVAASRCERPEGLRRPTRCRWAANPSLTL